MWIGLVAVALLAGCKMKGGLQGTPQEAPPFPWPPPAASAAVELTRPLVDNHPPFSRLGDANAVLQTALQQTGYVETVYFAVPDGFALVTKLERIESYGASRPEIDRWSLGPWTVERFSLRDYLRALFTADPGHYRIMVFIVTDVAVTQSNQRITEDDALAWLREGRQGLPPAIALRPWTPEVTCTALIYEFIRDQEQEPRVIVPGALGGLTHLRLAGTRGTTPKLWGALGLSTNTGG
jgi:hypothetical protein